MSWFSTRTELHTRIRELEEENTAITQAAERLHKSYKDERADLLRRIDNLVDDKHRLRIKGEALTRALRVKQREVDNALDECKRLHRVLSGLDVENLRLNGELATAEERLAGYEKAAA